ncbi:MAG: DUF4350 domain-containing protein [Gemmatimonadales bacterium]
MSPDRRFLIGTLALIALLALIVANAGTRRRPTPGADVRPSTLITEPNGASAVAEAARRLGVDVRELRQERFATMMDSGSATAVILLNPSRPVSGSDVDALLELPRRGVSLLFAGSTTRAVLRCLGFDTLRLDRGSRPVPDAVTPVDRPDGRLPAPRVRLALRETTESEVVDSSRLSDALVYRCDVVRGVPVDTLLTAGGSPVAVRLRPPGGSGTVTLVGDVGLFRNQTLRETDAGAVVLPWLLDYQVVWFDEFRHGFSEGGSMVDFVMEWAARSPWGWLVWHAIVVGLLALAAGAVRFGPPVEAFDRRRRSVAEHVRALAAALRAAGGHGLAIGLLVGGVRRRLGRPSSGQRDSWRSWLEQIRHRTRNQKVVALGQRLEALDRPQPSESDVLTAANLVEDMWNEMSS